MVTALETHCHPVPLLLRWKCSLLIPEPGSSGLTLRQHARHAQLRRRIRQLAFLSGGPQPRHDALAAGRRRSGGDMGEACEWSPPHLLCERSSHAPQAVM